LGAEQGEPLSLAICDEWADAAAKRRPHPFVMPGRRSIGGKQSRLHWSGARLALVQTVFLSYSLNAGRRWPNLVRGQAGDWKGCNTANASRIHGEDSFSCFNINACPKGRAVRGLASEEYRLRSGHDDSRARLHRAFLAFTIQTITTRSPVQLAGTLSFGTQRQRIHETMSLRPGAVISRAIVLDPPHSPKFFWSGLVGAFSLRVSVQLGDIVGFTNASYSALRRFSIDSELPSDFTVDRMSFSFTTGIISRKGRKGTHREGGWRGPLVALEALFGFRGQRRLPEASQRCRRDVSLSEYLKGGLRPETPAIHYDELFAGADCCQLRGRVFRDKRIPSGHTCASSQGPNINRRAMVSRWREIA